MAMGLPQNFEKEGLLKRANNQKLIADSGNSLILAGSCSNAIVIDVDAPFDPG